MYKLMIKQHNITGLKYLCITKKDNYIRYLGSGTSWKKHIEENGKNITTTLLYETDDYDEFLEYCHYYSDLYDVAHSDKWANIIPEHGYDYYGKSNVEVFWETVDELTKQNVIEKRNNSITKSHWSKQPDNDEIKRAIGKANKDNWQHLDQNSRNKRITTWREGFFRMVNEKGDNYQDWRSKISSSVKQTLDHTPAEVLSERNRKARHNISKESAEKRKEKIQEVYKSGKHDHLFERYSAERNGHNNPAAKSIIVDDIEYGSISDAMKQLGLTRAVINGRLKSDRWPKWKRK